MLGEQDPLTATFDDVARAADVSRPLVHTYLGDRRGMVDAVQVRIVARLDRWVEHGLRRAGDRRARLHAVVDGTFSFVTAERDAWGVLAATGGLDHPALHQIRARWSALVAVDGEAADPPAQAVVGGLLLGVGPWVARAVEPGQVLPGFSAALDLPAR
ncbi:MAG: hypothetical protein JWN46_3436 [Acidimicrobiales bacterium]|nr:hypothetical protein [Acidimicrobiales bacterium]